MDQFKHSKSKEVIPDSIRPITFHSKQQFRKLMLSTYGAPDYWNEEIHKIYKGPKLERGTLKARGLIF